VSLEPFTGTDVIGEDHVIWQTNLGDVVRADFGADYDRLANAARLHYANEGGLEKHDLFIAEWVTAGRDENLVSAALQQVCAAILAYARRYE